MICAPEVTENRVSTGPVAEPPAFCSQLKNSYIRTINTIVTVTNATGYFLLGSVGPYTMVQYGYGPGLQGLALVAPTVAFLLGTPLSVWLSRSPSAPWIVASVGLSLSSLGLGLAGVPTHVSLLLTGISLQFVGWSFVGTPCLPLLSDVVGMGLVPHGSGQVYSMADTFICFGCAVGPMVAAVPVPFWIMCQIVACCNLLMIPCCLHLRSLQAWLSGEGAA